jgi:nicotinate-nucleotide pyrophosphorylase (carboxylating)
MMQLREALAAGVDMVLLDNYTVEDLAAAVAFAKGKLQLEASGGITLENVARVAETGVDYISIGAITKNIIPMDLSMRFIG